jgi:hypothetical protein
MADSSHSYGQSYGHGDALRNPYCLGALDEWADIQPALAITVRRLGYIPAPSTGAPAPANCRMGVSRIGSQHPSTAELRPAVYGGWEPEQLALKPYGRRSDRCGHRPRHRQGRQPARHHPRHIAAAIAERDRRPDAA